MADLEWKVVVVFRGGWRPVLFAFARWKNRLIEIFEQGNQRRILDLELGVGEFTSGSGGAAVILWGYDFLGEAEELEGRLDLGWELGNFRDEHHAVAMGRKNHRTIF